ncbi:MAG: tetratricopeptide repeat protein [Thermodesulfovibrionales bacterium]|nr:tetratricopeptide repeat protein [Thermodesulfovibrionales bacterium]
MRKILPIVFFAGVLAAFLTPMELGDVWWHLRTGQWIWENKGLPQADPFSIAPAAAGQGVLASFWLCQLMLYGVYGLAGVYGLIALKALVFCLTFLLMESLLKGCGLKSPLRYILLLPSVFIATFYDEMRPQTLSFLFFAAVLYVLEKYWNAEGDAKAEKGIMALPGLMLLWSNMHAGFVSGAALIIYYAATGPAWGRGVSRAAALKGLAISAASVALSGLNPNGLRPVSLTFGMVAGSMKGAAPIHEHLPVREFAHFTGQGSLHSAIIALTAAGGAVFIANFIIAAFWKPHRIEPGPRPSFWGSHLLLFAGLSYASFATFRAGLFFALVWTLAVGKTVSAWPLPEMKQSRALGRLKGLSRALALSALLIAIGFVLLPRTVMRTPAVDERLIPVKAANFIEAQMPPGNIYHPYEWGGYLMWRLYPQYRVFIDGRALARMDEYFDVLEARPAWDDILSRYEVNTVVYWPLLPYRKNVPALVFALMRDEGWSPVYWDLQSIAFVRKRLAKNPIGKGAVWELLQSLVTVNIMSSPRDPKNYIALGEVYMERGLKYDARDAFKRALELDPGSREAAFYLGTPER